MQHDYVLKKLNVDLLSPSPGFRWGGRGSRANYLLYVAASVIACNLIYSIALF